MELVIANLAERPDLRPRLDDLSGIWPAFIDADPFAALYYGIAAARYPEFVLVAVDPAADVAVARAFSVPFRHDEPELPVGGWDQVIQRAIGDNLAGRATDLVSALEITVRPSHRGRGLSAVMLDHLRDNAARLGYRTLVAPVRPSGKHEHPDLPMTEYVDRVRADGLPVDPWLRVHVRAGGKIESIAPRSMTVAGTLAEWRRWTGLPFDTTGPVRVPRALVPVHCDLAHDHAVYVEPNVWMRHHLT